MAGVNDDLLDAAIQHQIDLTRYSNGVVRRLIAILNRADDRLYEELRLALERLPPEAFTVERLEAMLGAVRALNAQAYSTFGEKLREELRNFVEFELQYQHQTFEAILPPPVHARIASVTPEQVYAAAMARPFQGALLKGFLDDLEAGKAKKIRQAVAQGYVEGRTTPQIVREIRGTRAKGYSDGITEITRRNAEAVVRTAVSHTAGVTRDRFFEANKDIVKAVSWVSTLDGRTSQICRARDGKRYTLATHAPIGHELPWLGGPGRAHWQCRSTAVPVTKSWRELGIDMDEFTPTTRASMDGQVPASTTYGEWLRKQPAAKQDDILGPDRGALFRSGRMPMERFENDRGRTLTLKQLQEKQPEAFAKAGLDLPYKPPPGVRRDAIARFLESPAQQRVLLEKQFARHGYSFEEQLAAVRRAKQEQGYTASDEALLAVRYYTGRGYEDLNANMRTSAGTLEDRQLSALIVSALPGIGEFKGEAWRAPTKTAEGGAAQWKAAKVGEPLELGYQLQSFTTASALAARWAKKSDVIVRMAQSRTGVYIGPLSLYPRQHEVLVPPSTTYRVAGKQQLELHGKLFRVIDLEIDGES